MGDNTVVIRWREAVGAGAELAGASRRVLLLARFEPYRDVIRVCTLRWTDFKGQGVDGDRKGVIAMMRWQPPSRP